MFRVSLKMAWGVPASPVAGDDHGRAPGDAHAAEAAHGGGRAHHDDGKKSAWPDLNFREWTYCVIPAFLVLLIGLAPTPFLNMVTPSVDTLLTNHAIRRSNKAVVASIDASEAMRSAFFASTAVKMIMEPGQSSSVPATHLDAVAKGSSPAAADIAIVAAANQGETK
jgi:hypothetical protein